MDPIVRQTLKEDGWYLSDRGCKIISDSNRIHDIKQIMQRAIDYDLREICSGVDELDKNVILQIQKIRNVAVPKSFDKSTALRRLLKFSLTDGKNNYLAVEVEKIPCLSLNTPPGTKFVLNATNLAILHGIILLKPINMKQLLGGKVTNLIEKWELNKKLESHTRVRSTEEGGPPPWIPFGKKIIKITEGDKNFKALAEKDKPSKENTEFETQRKDAIAEAAKQGSKKIFGGGNNQLLDHSVQRIVDQGFSIEQAEYALKVNRNNVDRAIKSLKRTENRNSPREPKEYGNKKFDKKSNTKKGKSSGGTISLFDFLEDKLPVQYDAVETSYSSQNEVTTQLESRSNHDDQNRRGGRGRTPKFVKGSQTSTNHSVEESKNYRKPNPNNSNYVEYNGGNNSQQTSKPPRFLRNQDSYHDQYQNEYTNRGIQKYNNSNGLKSTQSRSDPYKTTQYSNYKNYKTDTRNQPNYDNSHSNRNNRSTQETSSKSYYNNTSSDNKNYKIQSPEYSALLSIKSTMGQKKEANGSNNVQKGKTNYNNIPNNTCSTSNVSPWTWRVGDECMAKYWEDNRYYTAVVTGISERTIVVQFEGFKNYEEVLKMDCIPITDEQGSNIQEYEVDKKRFDQRFDNRSMRQNQGYNNTVAGMQFRRSGTSTSMGNKAYGKRSQQRSSQPIYQPPAQRSYDSIPSDIHDTVSDPQLPMTKKNF